LASHNPRWSRRRRCDRATLKLNGWPSVTCLIALLCRITDVSTTTIHAATLDARVLTKLREQVDALGEGAQWLAVVYKDRVCVRDTSQMSAFAIRMWQKHPEAMIPSDENPGYQRNLVLIKPDQLQ
jgi:hypothetical protein